MAKSANTNLHKAKDKKNDEFYTQLSDIENELKHYKEHFKNAIVLCNCDDPEWSNFWKYFYLNFNALGLKKLISTHYNKERPTYKIEYDGISEPITTKLEGNGDFRSPECVNLLKEATIIVTNPPFSLFREYVGQLMEYNKKFLIVGTMNAISYKEIFPLIKENKLWLGFNSVKTFSQPDGSIKKFGNVFWYTNLDHIKRHEEFIIYKKYSNSEYTHYDNFDAIEVSKAVNIPVDYHGIMGVPISFLDKYNPEQFDIIGLGIANLGLSVGVQRYKPEHRDYRKNVQKRGCVDGDLYMVDKNNHPVVPYARVLIKRKG